MQNDPSSRPRHPLDRDPEPPSVAPPPAEDAGARRVMLHIPSVRPTVTWIIIAVNVLIFLVRALSRQADFDLLVWGANQPFAVLGNGEAYRLFTSMFLHSSIYTPAGGFALQNALHLIFNMFILYMEGTRAEQLFGHARFLAIYLLGGLAGSVLSAVFNLPVETYSLGASGAVFAVLGARMVFLYRHRRLFGAGGRAEMGRVGQLLAINLIFGLITAAYGSALGRIDNWAHLGGAIGGAVLAWQIAPFFILRRDPARPEVLVAEDINPLRGRYRDIVLFIVALMAILIIARLGWNA
jgi:rhomboid protease GluP